MSWTRRDVLATTMAVTAQTGAALVASVLVGVIWSRYDGTPLVARWSDALAIAGPLWLVASGTFASKLTVLSYMKWGIRERNSALYGDDIGVSDTGGVLTSFGEAMLVAAILLTLSVVIG